jgi:hypothetical protein
MWNKGWENSGRKDYKNVHQVLSERITGYNINKITTKIANVMSTPNSANTMNLVDSVSNNSTEHEEGRTPTIEDFNLSELDTFWECVSLSSSHVSTLTC